MAPADIVERREGVGAARTRRRRLPDGHEVVVHEARRRQAALPLLQRRRVRAGHVQGPRDHAVDAARADRGLRDRRVRDRRRDGATSTSAASSPSRSQRDGARRSRRRTRPASSARTRWARASASTCYVHKGAGAYICGEETALMNSLEGRRGNPRIKPPFPAVVGRVRPADDDQQRRDARRGAAHPRRTAPSGTRRCRSSTTRRAPARSSSRCAATSQRPGNYEVAMGFPFKEFLYDLCGGPLPGRKFKAVIPGGVVGPDPDDGGSRSDAHGLRGLRRAAGPMLGSGGVIVIDDAQCMVKQIARLARFFAHESCAQCTQCREGTAWTTKILERIEAGEGTMEDLDTLLEHRREHDRQDDLRAERLVRDAGRVGDPEVPRMSSRRTSPESACPMPTRGGSLMTDAKMITLTIEGRQVTRARGHVDPRGGEGGGRAHPALLLPPGASGRRRVPHVPRRGREGAEARARVRDGGRRRAGRARALREGARGTQGRARVAAHQPPARLSRSATSRASASCRTTPSRKGAQDSRYREPKRFNPVEDFGGDVVYVANRCILCTRCVRFMDDVAQDPVLNVSERGDRAVIGKFEGQDLTHPWAGNVVDLCPVGALLSKDFLNKARAWELDRTASVCPNCTQGCNTIVETRDNVVVRMRPRPNDDVNKYFMCDYGRLNYRWMNRPDRLEAPLVQARRPRSRPPTGRRRSRRRRSALEGKRAFVLASPMLSNEALFLLARLVEQTGGHGRVPRRARRRSAAARRRGPRAARATAPRTSNGAELLGLRAHRHAARRARAAATCSSSRTRSSPALDAARRSRVPRAVVVIGTDAARDGLRGRRRRAADREHGGGGGHVHQPARARAAVPAGEGGAGHGAAELVRARRSARRSWASRADYFLASDVFAALAGARSRVRGDDVRHARPARPRRWRAQARCAR